MARTSTRNSPVATRSRSGSRAASTSAKQVQALETAEKKVVQVAKQLEKKAKSPKRKAKAKGKGKKKSPKRKAKAKRASSRRASSRRTSSRASASKTEKQVEALVVAEENVVDVANQLAKTSKSPKRKSPKRKSKAKAKKTENGETEAGPKKRVRQGEKSILNMVGSTLRKLGKPDREYGERITSNMALVITSIGAAICSQARQLMINKKVASLKPDTIESAVNLVFPHEELVDSTAVNSGRRAMNAYKASNIAENTKKHKSKAKRAGLILSCSVAKRILGANGFESSRHTPISPLAIVYFTGVLQFILDDFDDTIGNIMKKHEPWKDRTVVKHWMFLEILRSKQTVAVEKEKGAKKLASYEKHRTVRAFGMKADVALLRFIEKYYPM